MWDYQGHNNWWWAIDNIKVAVADTDAPTISIKNNENGTITVTFEGKLQSASAVNGPWHDVNAVSPLIINTDDTIQFGRAVRGIGQLLIIVPSRQKKHRTNFNGSKLLKMGRLKKLSLGT